MQQWNIYRSRAIGHWLQKNNVSVIPNIRFGDERTYSVACCGVQRYGMISLGTHGCIKGLIDRSYFVEGLEYIINELQPSAIIVYGSTPDKIFGKYRENGIEIIQFDSEFMKSRKAVSA